MNKIKLTISLIRKEFVAFEDIKSEEAKILYEYSNDKIAYYEKSASSSPKWMKDFFMKKDVNIFQSNARVLCLVRVQISETENRIFAITFGYGKFLVQDERCEENFGLKIVLNSIDKNKIKRITKTDIGKNYKQTNEQLPRESDIVEFGFDENRELMKYVTGKCESGFFKDMNITGGDSLFILFESTVNDIELLLKNCYKIYQSNAYKQHFDWIDNIKEVRNKRIIKQLEEKAMESFLDEKNNNLWLSVPEFISWERVIHFKLQGQKNIEYQDIDMKMIDDIPKSNKTSFAEIKNLEVRAVSGVDSLGTEYSWKLSKCIVGNVDLGDCSYAINNGKWYEIDKHFVKLINDKYDEIRISSLEFIDYSKSFKDESEYNNILVQKYKKYESLHKIKFPIGGGSGNNIEICDIYYDKHFVHIKKSESSAYLSHLFNQALVSASILLSEHDRNRYNDLLRKNKLEDVTLKSFNPQDYTIVLAIINKNNQNQKPHIPFFSKVSISYAYNNITRLGYHVELKSIPIK